MPNNYLNLTLGELLSHANAIIKRNAMSILKQLQKANSEPSKGQICYCQDTDLSIPHYTDDHK